MAVMTTNNHDKPLTLGQIQDILDIPQHVLIHLCEKKVILPDFSDTKGRGQSRLFSKRNLLEFAIALHIRQFQIPVMATRVIILVLRKFEEKVQKKIKGFTLESLTSQKSSPKLTLYIEEGEYLIFALKSKNNSLLLKCSMSSFEKKKPIHFVALSGLSSNFNSRLEINISKIIENLLKKSLL